MFNYVIYLSNHSFYVQYFLSISSLIPCEFSFIITIVTCYENNRECIIIRVVITGTFYPLSCVTLAPTYNYRLIIKPIRYSELYTPPNKENYVCILSQHSTWNDWGKRGSLLYLSYFIFPMITKGRPGFPRIVAVD